MINYHKIAFLRLLTSPASPFCPGSPCVHTKTLNYNLKHKLQQQIRREQLDVTIF